MLVDAAFTWSWKILQWPIVFGLVALAVAMVYYFAPDAEQEWIWITPGSVFATVLWLLLLAAIVHRIRREEAHMHELFGAAYDRYTSETARLVPGVY